MGKMTVRRKLAIASNPELASMLLMSLGEVSNSFYVASNAKLAQCLVDLLIGQVQASTGILGSITTSDNHEACTCVLVGDWVVADCQ
mgnify:FL=1